MGIQSAGPAGSLAIPEPPAGTEPPVGTPFPGILHPGPAPTKAEDDPACFRDLHLDEIVDAATSGLEGFRLAPFFRTPCPDGTCVLYRQAVFRDLEEPAVAAAVRGFAAGMAEMRSRLGRLRKARYTLERRWWLVRAAVAYCEAVTGLHDTLDGLPVASEGLRGLGRMLLELTGAEAFRAIERDAAAAVAGLAEIRYRLHIAGGRITVTRAGPDAPDYGAEVLATFERFRHGAGRESGSRSRTAPSSTTSRRRSPSGSRSSSPPRSRRWPPSRSATPSSWIPGSPASSGRSSSTWATSA